MNSAPVPHGQTVTYQWAVFDARHGNGYWVMMLGDCSSRDELLTALNSQPHVTAHNSGNGRRLCAAYVCDAHRPFSSVGHRYVAAELYGLVWDADNNRWMLGAALDPPNDNLIETVEGAP